MCGIAGLIDFRACHSHDALQEIVTRMVNTLIHRGPDDGGAWVDAAAGVALGHRRLAILDLSEAGRQPMVSPRERYVITYNGELYNFQELRRELDQCGDEPVFYRGHSDTEVMLACFDRWGINASLLRMNGMFAFAVWDRKERTLYLCRDRLGEKPLYYRWAGSVLMFASELKALRAHPEFQAEIDRDALAAYMRHNCVPAPFSIYKGVRKLLPGTCLAINGDSGPGIVPVPYWTLKEAAERGTADPFRGSEQEALEQLDELVRDAVKIRMLSDVPLGAFLSGGIDSSLITALMQAQSMRPVKTFTIGFREPNYNEARDAALVARHLGTEHTDLYVTPAEAMAAITSLPSVYDEPFSDSSQIPTLLLARMTRRFVTVGLSGDGGDEVFGGYLRHIWADRVLKMTHWMPQGARRSLATAIQGVSATTWDSWFSILSPILPEAAKQRFPGMKLHKLAGLVGSPDPHSGYLGLTSHWTNASSIVIGAKEPEALLHSTSTWADLREFTQQIMFLDSITYLPDDILVKVDRASMAASLEMRVPFLDHRLVEFAWSLPVSWKVRAGQGKHLLRQILYRHVPRNLVDRPKSGFTIPLESWLRGPLREWAESLLSEQQLRNDGFLDPRPIRQIWQEHLSGRGTWQYHLWDVLMFQSWLDENKGCSSQPLCPVLSTARVGSYK